MLFSFTLFSCRTENEWVQQETTKEEVGKFLPFTKRNAYDEIDYAKGFKDLALRYDSLHRRNITGRNGIDRILDKLKLSKRVSFSELADIEYIDFSIRSELVEEENGDKWVLYPRIQGGKVKNLVSAVLSEDETKLGYYTLDYPNALYIANIELFREAYERAKSERGSVDGYITYDGICGISNRADCVIKGIIIRPVREKPDYDGGGRGSGSYYGGDSGGGGEGCSPYEACSPGNSDGGGYPYPPNNGFYDPLCEKNKTQVIKDIKVQNAIQNLKEHLNKTRDGERSERGWRFIKDGTSSEALIINNHRLQVGEVTEMQGFYHNHTGMGIDIFSPQDIASLISIARFQNIGEESEAFFGVVSYGSINYIMRWNAGRKEFPKYDAFSKEELDDLAKAQWDMYIETFVDSNLTQTERLELVFYETLKMMKIESKISLYRVDQNNHIFSISQNKNGSIDSKPCN